MQARARAGRALISETPHPSMKSAHFNYAGLTTPEKFEPTIRAKSTMKPDQHMMLKRNGSRSNGNSIYDPEKSQLSRHRMERRTGERSWEQGSFTRIVPMDDERTDKILEVDTGKSHVTPKCRSIFHSSHLSHSSDQYSQSFCTSNDSTARQTTALSPLSGLGFRVSSTPWTDLVKLRLSCSSAVMPCFLRSRSAVCRSSTSARIAWP
ncbi:UNVERIFIED_CONTAM: hypothetical protein Sangu_2754800 [Sesamum angustifolium]|uniref:Uncharacterized protein n=1 Tax=Sesamum angustifolium TaxID=2727405 RepID=A0AAW2IX20_9LAMI